MIKSTAHLFWILLFACSVCWMNAEPVEDEVTVVEVLDLSGWMSDELEVSKSLMGSWKTDTLGEITVMRAPFSANSCFVQADGRIVPAFQVNVGAAHFLVVGLHSSTDLELVPEVFQFEVSKDGVLKDVFHLKAVGSQSSFKDMESFVSFIKKSEYEGEFQADPFLKI